MNEHNVVQVKAEQLAADPFALLRETLVFEDLVAQRIQLQPGMCTAQFL